MFGGQASTPFGASSGGFGQPSPAPTFGSAAPAAPFGAPAPSGGFGGFGAPAPAPSGFGGFGASAAPSTGFGGFGAPAPAPSAFGASVGGFGATPAPSLFGTPAPAPGGLFGSSPAPASGGLFGSAPAPSTGGFGSSAVSSFGGGGFGAAPSSTFGGGSTFGAPPASSSGLFLGGSSGNSMSTTGGFGSSTFGSTNTGAFGTPAPAPASTGLFGAPSTAPAPGLFGAPSLTPGGAGSGGTKIQPYQVTNRPDGTSNISLQAITGMPAYENKSFEELRFEDYGQGNRGSGGAPPTSTGFGATTGFGAPAPSPSGGLFGAAAPVSAFGAPAPAPSGFGGFGSPAPAPGLFGAPAPAPFGAPAPALFGSPAPAPFGVPAPTTGGFGMTSFGAAKPPASGGLFGAPAPAPVGLFGSMPAPAPSGGLFGSTSAPAPSAFGAPAPSTGLFGAPAPAAPFGASSTAFGAPAPAPFGGGFGAPAPAPLGGSLFGAPAPPPAFGTPAPAGGLFGAPPAPGSSLFGAPKPAGTSLFGAPAPAPPAPFGFGAPAPGAFGAAPAPFAMPAPPPVGAIIPPANDEVLAAQVAALEKYRKELDNNDTFRKRSSYSANVSGASQSERDIVALMPARTPYSFMYRASPKSGAKIRPRGFSSPEQAIAPSLSRLGSGGKPMVPPDRLVAQSATRLVINPSPKPKLKLSLQPGNSSSPLLLNNEAEQSQQRALRPNPKPIPPASPAGMQQEVDTRVETSNEGYAYYKNIVGSPHDDTERGVPSQGARIAPSLTKAEYSCTPPIDVLATFSEADLAAVSNFSVVRPGVGRIEWEGAVDIRGTDLDQVVIIEPKSASVYMNEEEDGSKPAVGTKLNRSAIITLERVFAPEATMESQDKFARKVERQTRKMGAELVNYDPATGVWKLRVQHFSRYALDDEDDSSSETEALEHKSTVQLHSVEHTSQTPLFHEVGIGRQQATPFRPRTKTAVLVEDDDTEDMEEEAFTAETKRIADAETAFSVIKTKAKERSILQRRLREESPPFRDEANPLELVATCSQRYVPSTADLEGAQQGKASVCHRFSQGGPKIRYSTDSGMAIGRSFRVGWLPDGSFFTRGKGFSMIRCAPRFSSDETVKDESLRFLEKHHAAVSTVVGNDGSQLRLPSGDSLKSVLKGFVDIAPPANKDSFALVQALTSGVPGQASRAVAASDYMGFSTDNLDCRRIFAVQEWLIESCREDVDNEVKRAIAKGSKPLALLSAVSGGDLEYASDIASQLGFHRFANLLSVGPEARADILEEARSSQMSEELLRAYLIVGGDMKKEEEMYVRRQSSFDWRRRLAMTLCFSKRDDPTFSSLLADYKAKVRQGLAPSPKPTQTADANHGVESACFSLLCSAGETGEGSLIRIAHPLGHGRSIHDYSTSFHISTVLSASSFAFPMASAEEQVLIEGYASQLLSYGHWEWAVYTLLCNLGKSQRDFRWCQSQARDIILRNFRDHMNSQRRFLEGVGVPPGWFFEAIARQCACEGDLVGYLSHMVKVDPDEACVSLESTLIPNMLFLSKDAIIEARMVLKAFSGSNDDSLSTGVEEIFDIYEELLRLERFSREDIEEITPSLIARCETVEKTLASYNVGKKQLQGASLGLVPGTKTVPMPCFLAESLSQISLFKLRLRALLSRTAVRNGAPSQLLDFTRSDDVVGGGISERENFLRGLL